MKGRRRLTRQATRRAASCGGGSAPPMTSQRATRRLCTLLLACCRSRKSTTAGTRPALPHTQHRGQSLRVTTPNSRNILQLAKSEIVSHSERSHIISCCNGFRANASGTKMHRIERTNSVYDSLIRITPKPVSRCYNDHVLLQRVMCLHRSLTRSTPVLIDTLAHHIVLGARTMTHSTATLPVGAMQQLSLWPALRPAGAAAM